MKCAALALCAGCNSWFGLDPTTEIIPDAIDAPIPTATVIVSNRVGSTSGATGSSADVAIPGATIRANGAVVPYDASGTVTVPAAITTAPWKLEIDSPAPFPTMEVQWQPASGHVCLPRWGRLDRAPLSGTNDIYMAVNAAALEAPQVLTSGVWSQTILSSASTQIDLVWDPSVVHPMDGDLAQIGADDWMMVVDYSKSSTDLGRHEAHGYGRVPAVLNAMPATPVNLVNIPPAKQSTFFADIPDNTAFNLFTAAQVSTASTYAARVGLVASDHMPAQALEGGLAKMFALGMYDQKPSTLAFTVIETDLTLPHASYIRRASPRMHGGISLESAVERVDMGTLGAYPSGASNTVDAGIATAVMLDAVPLSNADQMTAPPPASDPTLAWVTVGGRADLAVVTLSQLANGTLHTVEQFATTGSSVTIDKSLLQTGNDYVFMISLRTGYPGAATGDLCSVEYPMSDTQLYTAVVSVR